MQSDYVILIALPQQQWLHEHASSLRYTYIAHLVLYECTFDLFLTIHSQKLRILLQTAPTK